MAIRGIAAMMRSPELPFGWPGAALPGFAERVYAARERLLAPLYGVGIFFVIAAVAGTTIVRPRDGLFLLFLWAYLSAYPIVEYHNRNFFHLEVIGWLAIGFCVSRVASRVRTGRWGAEAIGWSTIRRRVLVGCATVAAVLSVLATLRLIQAANLKRIITRTVRAPSAPIAIDEDLQHGRARLTIPAFAGATHDPAWARLLRVELSPTDCGSGAITVRYDPPFSSITTTLPVAPARPSDAVTLWFVPLYTGFSSLDVGQLPPRCLLALKNVSGMDESADWFYLTLAPDWPHLPLYQTIETRDVLH
jgi:hypothetical protein